MLFRSQALDDYQALAAAPVLLGSPAARAAVQFQIGALLLTELNRPVEAAQAFQALHRDDLKDQPFARLARAVSKDASPAAE